MLEHTGDNHTRHTVTGIDDDLERLDLAYIDEGEGMLHIVVGDVTVNYLSFGSRLGEVAADCQVTDVRQACIQTDGESLCAAELHAVVFARVVGGGNHCPGRIVKL